MKHLSVITMFLLFATLCFAAPNLSGTWKLDTEKTDMSGRWAGRIAKTMTISQEENKLTIERQVTNRDGEEMTRTENYTLDNKLCKNESRMGVRESTVDADWESKIEISSVSKMERQGQAFEIKSTETWELTDANHLKIHTASETPMGEREQTVFYTKGE